MCDCGNIGGVGAPFNTPANTVGVGDVVMPSVNGYGSGDVFCNIVSGNNKPATKKAAYQEKPNKLHEVPSGFDMSPRPLIVPLKGK